MVHEKPSPNSVVHAAALSQNAGGARQLFKPHEAAPLVVVLGATGAGKSTLLNRITHPLEEKRVFTFKEGEGALSETQLPTECPAYFFGKQEDPINVMDMPGLDDSSGASQDTIHIQNAAKFLMKRGDPHAHLFVLVVNGASPRISGSIRNMMSTFCRVFDATGKKRFVDYLAVVFTKVEFNNFMYPEGDTDDDKRSKEEFDAEYQRKFQALTGDWAAELAKLLGHTDHETIQGLQSRFIMTDNAMPPRKIAKLRKFFKHDIQQQLGKLHLFALYKQKNPFPLAHLDDRAKSVMDQLQSDKEEQEKLIVEAEQKAKEDAAKHEKEIEEKQKQHEQSLKDMQEKSEEERKQLKANLDKELAELKKQAASSEKKHAEELDRLKKEQSASQAKLQATLAAIAARPPPAPAACGGGMSMGGCGGGMNMNLGGGSQHTSRSSGGRAQGVHRCKNGTRDMRYKENWGHRKDS